jgi:hypothetical protein
MGKTPRPEAQTMITASPGDAQLAGQLARVLPGAQVRLTGRGPLELVLGTDQK